MAQALGLGGFTDAPVTGPTRDLDREAGEVTDWETLAGNGALRHLVGRCRYQSTPISPR